MATEIFDEPEVPPDVLVRRVVFDHALWITMTNKTNASPWKGWAPGRLRCLFREAIQAQHRGCEKHWIVRFSFVRSTKVCALYESMDFSIFDDEAEAEDGDQPTIVNG